MEVKVKVDKERFNELIKKYPGTKGKIVNKVDDLEEKFNKKPFKAKTKKIWIEEIKEFITFINNGFKEGEDIAEISEEEMKELLSEAYDSIMVVLKKYCDLEEDYYHIIALWIIGTYFHEQFPTYPYLFFNAMKGSGKSRTMKLIIHLSKDGKMLNSLTEAILFRTKGTLAIDEFEGIGRKGKEALRELLNSSYKRGTKVQRMKKIKIDGVEDMVPEEFNVYRPILMANISGMEEVLGDRCIPLILEKSNKKKIVNLVEIFDIDFDVKKAKEKLDKCSLCSFVALENIYLNWNEYMINSENFNYTNYIDYTNYTNYTNYTEAFKTLNLTDLGGRDLELSLPLLILSSYISQDNLIITTLILTKLHSSKKEEELNENMDVILLDFIAQEPEKNTFIRISEILENFRKFTQNNEEWLNNRWVGNALKRLKILKEKRRRAGGVEVRLNYEKAQEKIKIFK